MGVVPLPHGFDSFYSCSTPPFSWAPPTPGWQLVPVPKVASLAELNARLQAADDADDARRIAHRVRTVGQNFAVEAPLLRPLPVEGFEAGLSLHPLVDRHSRVMVRQCHYSVPARLIRRRVPGVAAGLGGSGVRRPR